MARRVALLASHQRFWHALLGFDRKHQHLGVKSSLQKFNEIQAHLSFDLIDIAILSVGKHLVIPWLW